MLRVPGRYEAFTLIELLIVVAIIALLVAILVPSLQQAQALAKQTVCASNVKQISYGLRMYADDNGGKAPSQVEGSPGWEIWMLPYLSQNEEYDYAYYDRQSIGGSWFGCPANADSDDVAYDDRFPKGRYGMNYPVVTAYEPHSSWPGHTGGARIDKVASELMMVAASSSSLILTPFVWGSVYDSDGDYVPDSPSHYMFGTKPIYRYHCFRPRHPSGANILFGDYHVGSTTIQEWLDDYELWGRWP